MDYEKKYKNALEKAKEIANDKHASSVWKGWLCNCFPELKESEDERIRKDLIEWINEFPDTIWRGHYKKDIIAWLEKQGEQEEPQVYETEDGEIITYSESEGYKIVEPKFKVGDWITNGNITIQIEAIKNDCYLYCGDCALYSIKTADKVYHLWTIQDAKDGDVLAGNKGDVILMFRRIGNTEWDDVIDYHCYYDCYRKDFIVQEDVGYWGNTKNNQLVPATKEQRDTLMKAMTDAGYTFDFEKKELKLLITNGGDFDEKNCEQKHSIDINKMVDDYANNKERGNEEFGKPVPCMIRAYRQGLNDAIGKVVLKSAWSEEDEKIALSIEQVINCASLLNIVPEKVDKIRTWLKSLKDRVQPQYEWSEEDIRNIQDIDSVLFYDKSLSEDTCMRLRNWLESLRPQNRWKPSDEQMKALSAINVTGCVSYAGQGRELINLYNELKKLRGE